MAEAFKVEDVSDWQEVLPEQMGSKEKSWLKPDDNGPSWLFKIPRSGTGEHWAEIVAAEVARLLDLQHARVMFARRGDVLGTISLSFLSDGSSLVHGNELMSEINAEYAAMEMKPIDHTVSNIFDCLDSCVIPKEAKHQFVGYLVLDAIIANTDRHHENWGVVVDDVGRVLAPTYDHASSLARELPDKRRESYLKSWGAKWYVDRGKGGIFRQGLEQQVPPYELLGDLDNEGCDSLRQWQENLASIGKEAICATVDGIPVDIMSETAKTFSREMLSVGFDLVLEALDE